MHRLLLCCAQWSRISARGHEWRPARDSARTPPPVVALRQHPDGLVDGGPTRRCSVVACGHIAAQRAAAAAVALHSDLLQQELAMLTTLLPAAVQVRQEGSEHRRRSGRSAPCTGGIGATGAGILADDLPAEVHRTADRR